jgi:membrane-associated phospholipid phosphatase
VPKPLDARNRPNRGALPRWRRLSAPPTSWAFSSGHSAAFVTAVTMEFPAAGAVVAPLAATVAYSRVHTGVRWPSDVLGGLVLGSGIALATRRWWPM